MIRRLEVFFHDESLALDPPFGIPPTLEEQQWLRFLYQSGRKEQKPRYQVKKLGEFDFGEVVTNFPQD